VQTALIVLIGICLLSIAESESDVCGAECYSPVCRHIVLTSTCCRALQWFAGAVCARCVCVAALLQSLMCCSAVAEFCSVVQCGSTRLLLY